MSTIQELNQELEERILRISVLEDENQRLKDMLEQLLEASSTSPAQAQGVNRRPSDRSDGSNNRSDRTASQAQEPDFDSSPFQRARAAARETLLATEDMTSLSDEVFSAGSAYWGSVLDRKTLANPDPVLGCRIANTEGNDRPAFNIRKAVHPRGRGFGGTTKIYLNQVAFLAAGRGEELRKTGKEEQETKPPQVSHLCHNIKCVNIEHLRIESPSLNRERNICQHRLQQVCRCGAVSYPCPHGDLDGTVDYCRLRNSHVRMESKKWVDGKGTYYAPPSPPSSDVPAFPPSSGITAPEVLPDDEEERDSQVSHVTDSQTT